MMTKPYPVWFLNRQLARHGEVALCSFVCLFHLPPCTITNGKSLRHSPKRVILPGIRTSNLLITRKNAVIELCENPNPNVFEFSDEEFMWPGGGS